jgi:exonuclease SbcC
MVYNLDLMLWKLKYKVADLESIENFGTTARPCCDRWKIKKADVLFWKPKRKKKEYKQELTKLQAELTTLKSKRLDGTILMDLGNWYTIRESFSTMERNPK